MSKFSVVMSKKIFAALLALTGWFAVIAQYVLALQTTEFSFGKTTLNIFSYFTILTNTASAVYFSLVAAGKTSLRPGSLTAITLHMIVVGVTYQVILRGIWDPQGLQQVVDELLHTVLPIGVLVFWFCFEKRTAARYAQIPRWLVYPLLFLVYTLIRGSFAGWYPYPFIDVSKIGMAAALRNALFVSLFYLTLAFLLVFLSRNKRVSVANSADDIAEP